MVEEARRNLVKFKLPQNLVYYDDFQKSKEKQK